LSGIPHYPMEAVRQLAAASTSRSVTLTATKGATSLGLETEDVWKVVQSLTLHDFYKAMESEKVPGLWQDVYKVRYGDQRLYVKVQLLRNDSIVHVVSFKEDTSHDR
jgi:motility quorum-sensing regulator / GCU-specific mRNA interferase toxin